MPVLLSWVWENSHSRRSSFRGLRQEVETDKPVDLTLVGTNLDRVAKVRFGEAAKPPEKDDPKKTMTFVPTLPLHDPKFAAGNATITLPKGDYSVSLETTLQQTIPTSLTLTVKDSGASGSNPPSDAPVVDGPKDQFLAKPQKGKPPGTKDVTFTGTHLDQIKSFIDADPACKDVDTAVIVKIKNPPAPTTTSMTLTITVTDAAKTTKTVTSCVLENSGSKAGLPLPFEIRDSK
jgi:hypothetical protein